jgi:hypothetical protein
MNKDQRDVSLIDKGKMSEPIAWTNKENLKYLQVARHANIWNQSVQKNDIPLYTHPMRELTDEEIIAIYRKIIRSPGHDFDCTFARAIIKASRGEK